MLARSVLLVEDDDEVRNIVAEILTQNGFTVTSACDGLSAWDMLNSESFDLVITDMGLPGMNGEELLINMRKSSIGTPVILISAVKFKKGHPSYDDLSGYRLIHKPFEINEMKKIILDLLNEKIIPQNDNMRSIQIDNNNDDLIIVNNIGS